MARIFDRAPPRSLGPDPIRTYGLLAERSNSFYTESEGSRAPPHETSAPPDLNLREPALAREPGLPRGARDALRRLVGAEAAGTLPRGTCRAGEDPLSGQTSADTAYNLASLEETRCQDSADCVKFEGAYYTFLADGTGRVSRRRPRARDRARFPWPALSSRPRSTAARSSRSSREKDARLARGRPQAPSPR